MSSSGPEISISLQDLVAFVLRGLVVAVVLAGIAGVATYALTQRQPPQFRAEATLLVARATGGLAPFGLSPVTAPPLDMSAYRAAAQSDRVLADALRLLGVEEPSEAAIRGLRGRSSSFVSSDGRDSSLLSVEGRGQTPAEAVDRANAVAEALVGWDRRRATESLTRGMTALEQQINALGEQIRALQASPDGAAQTQIDGLVRLRAEHQQQLAYARALLASAEGVLSVMQPAGTTPRQVAPRPFMNAVVAALLAVALTYALLLVRSAFNTRLRDADDVAAASGLAMLAEFPRALGPKDEWRQQEASNYLRTSVLFATADAHPKVILITSAAEEEGKTTIACHLAEGLARNGYRTLLVDADLRSPSIGERYGVDDRDTRVTTTREWMTDTSSRSRNVLKVTLDASTELFIVPQFWTVSDAPESLGRGFPRALTQWDGYDVIIVDTAPVLSVADTLAIAPYCTGTILVVDMQHSDRRQLIGAQDLLERVGVTILGVVANKVRRSSRGGVSYGSNFGSSYGRQPEPRGRPSPPTRDDVPGAVRARD